MSVPNLLLELSVLKDSLIQTEMTTEKAQALLIEQKNRIQLLQPNYYRLASVSCLFGVKALPEDEDDRRWYRMMQKKYDVKAEKRDAIIYAIEMQAQNHDMKEQAKIQTNNEIQGRKNGILK